MGPPDRLSRAARSLESARELVVVTGAGMSQESGIPTFRDAREGLWARFDPEELATRRAFREDPDRVWGWYCYRRRLVEKARPHPGHHALVRLEGAVPRVTIVTQNIDGLHGRAGSARVLEVHGNLWRFRCFERDHPVELSEEEALPPETEPTRGIAAPRCPRCGSRVRPDVVWFGEPLDEAMLARARSLAGSCDVMLVVGTSGVVYPAAALPGVAGSAGATLIEVNTEPSRLTSQADLFIEGTAGRVLPGLMDRVIEGGGFGG